MIDLDRGDGQVRRAKFLACLERNVLHDPATFVRQLIELRINRVVEDIRLQQIDDFLSCMNPNWLFELTKEIVNKDWQTGDVVHVRMRDNHVPHRLALGFRKSNPKTAGIDRDAVIDEKACQALRRSRAAAGIERTR